MSFSITFDWLESATTAVGSHAASWARLRVTLDDRVVTRVEHKRERVTRDTVAGPLMPLAEWIAANWWYLCEESPLEVDFSSPRRASERRLPWFRRHNWLYAREGFPLPDLTIARVDDGLSALAVEPDPMELEDGFPVRFIEGYRCQAPIEHIRDQLGSVVDAVIARTADLSDPDVVALRDRWNDIRQMPDEDRSLRERAAALGLDGDDPETVPDDFASQLLELSRLPLTVSQDLLDARPSQNDLSLLAKAIERARSARRHASSTDALGASRRALGPLLDSAEPHRAGWTLAAKFRRNVLGLEAAGAVDELFARIATERLVALHDDAFVLPDTSIRAWVDANNSDTAACVLWPLPAPARKFAVASAVGLSLLPPRERLLTRAATRAQSVARAFATELLAPVSWVRSLVRTPYVRAAEIDAWAKARGISPQPIRHQIENHDLATIEDA